MKMKFFFSTILLVSAGLLGWNLYTRQSPPVPTQRSETWNHVFLIVVDTLRRDHVSLYGDAARTPNMERLAAEGQIFNNVSASFHQTTMSMAALFTGRTPSLETVDGESLTWNGKTWCGLTRLAENDADSCIPRSVPTLAEEMRAIGFRTIGVVANELLYSPGGYERGFDEWIEIAPVDEPTGPFGNLSKTVSSLRRAPAVNAELFRVLDEQEKDRALFVYLHYIDVHDYDARNPAELRKSYARSVASFDSDLGDLLSGLEARNLLSDSLLVLTSDHGEALGEKHGAPSTRSHFGNPSFEPVLQIPLITSRPIHSASDSFLRSQDLFDLLLSASGKSPGTPEIAAEELFLSESRHQTYREGRWKSTRPREGGALILFDLEGDPGETLDVADQYPEIVARHGRRLDELSSDLATGAKVAPGLRPYDEERLRRLGYIE